MLRCEKCKHEDVSEKKYPCSKCDSVANDLFEPKKQTNADRIRSFSDEELADFIEMKQFFALANNGTDGEDFTLKWLQSEVEE